MNTRTLGEPRRLDLLQRADQTHLDLDDLADGIAAIEKTFQERGFVVPASIQLDELTALSWEKRGKLWGLHLGGVKGTRYISEECKTETISRPELPELRSIRPLSQSKLEEKLKAIEMLPELYAEMKRRTRMKSANVRGALTAIGAFLESMKEEGDV